MGLDETLKSKREEILRIAQRHGVGMALEWAALHQDELRQDWELARNGQVPRPIAPLT